MTRDGNDSSGNCGVRWRGDTLAPVVRDMRDAETSKGSWPMHLLTIVTLLFLPANCRIYSCSHPTISANSPFLYPDQHRLSCTERNLLRNTHICTSLLISFR